jgi:uncharacterized protein with PIN domain
MRIGGAKRAILHYEQRHAIKFDVAKCPECDEGMGITLNDHVNQEVEREIKRSKK